MDEPRNSTGIWLAVNGLLLAGLWVFSMWAFSNLPDRIPMHFDFYGNPDRWVSGSSREWFLVPGIATFLNALFLTIAVALPRMPLGAINLPNKERFLRLPRDRQLVVLHKVAAMLFSLALLPNLMFIGVQVMMYRVAHGATFAPSAVPMLAVPILALALTVLWIVHLTRTINRETRRLQGAADATRRRDEPL